MKPALFLIVFFAAGAFLASAHGSFDDAEKIIASKVPCSQLSDEQLESIGDYYMEQMHPGEAHELMDEQMGGEGSESLNQMHISMARSFYCGEKNYMSSGMMNMMMGNQMMGNYGSTSKGGNNMMYGYGMMGGWPAFYGGFSWLWMFVWLAFLVGVVWLVVWLVRAASEKNSGNALDALKGRYARGEISGKQYEKIKKEIGGK